VIDTLMDDLDLKKPKEASGHEEEEGMITMI
jgi:hypothetical protein